MTRRRPIVLVLSALGIAIGWLVIGAAPASAHAVVIGSTPTDGQTLPAPPQEVQITFSENVSAQKDGLTVLDSSGARVDNDDATVGTTGSVLTSTVKPNLPDGTYVMNYHVISADGHPVSAAIVFGVGSTTVIDTSGVQNLQAGKDPGFEFAAGVARFVTYAGAMLAAGLALFVTFVHDQRPDMWKLMPVVRAAAIIGGLGGVATVAVQAALLTGRGFAAMADVSALRNALTEGLDWATVLLLCGLALVHLSTDMAKPFTRQGLAFYGGLVVAASFALWGHNTTAQPRWLSFVADFVHVAAGSIWLGGIVGLGLTLWYRRRLPDADFAAHPVEPVVIEPATMAAATAEIRVHPDIPSLPVDPPPTPPVGADAEPGIATSTAGIVGRYSTLAAASVSLLVVAGITLAWEQLRGLDAFGSTDYGRALLIKIGLVLVILVGAAYNRFILIPRIEDDEQDALDASTADTAIADERIAFRTLTRTVLAEAIGLVLVLVVTSVLVNLTPPTSVAAGAITDTVQNSPVTDTDATVEVALVPAKVGTNSVHISYFDKINRAVDVAQQVSIEMTQPEQGIGPIQRDAAKAGTGHYIVDGLQVPTAGSWKLTLITRVSDFDQTRTDFTFTVTS